MTFPQWCCYCTRLGSPTRLQVTFLIAVSFSWFSSPSPIILICSSPPYSYVHLPHQQQSKKLARKNLNRLLPRPVLLLPNKHARTFDYDGEFMNHPSGFARAEGMLVAKMIVSVPGGLILNLRDEEFLRVFSSLIPNDHKSSSYYYSNSFIGHKSCGRLSEIISTD